MLMDDYLICKDYDQEILVDGINMYEADSLQYSLYTAARCSDKVHSMLNLDKTNEEVLLIFPFQCGIKFGSGYHLMNIRDCIGTITYDNLVKAYKGEL